MSDEIALCKVLPGDLSLLKRRDILCRNKIRGCKVGNCSVVLYPMRWCGEELCNVVLYCLVRCSAAQHILNFLTYCVMLMLHYTTQYNAVWCGASYLIMHHLII